jgi:hypothetical protein
MMLRLIVVTMDVDRVPQKLVGGSITSVGRCICKQKSLISSAVFIFMEMAN